MARDYLGLFDTPPNRTEIRIGLAIVAQMLIILLATLPVHNLHIGAIPGLIPALDAGMLACDLISAAILYAQAAVFRSRALTLLASGYVVSGLLLIPWALTFPGPSRLAACSVPKSTPLAGSQSAGGSRCRLPSFSMPGSSTGMRPTDQWQNAHQQGF